MVKICVDNIPSKAEECPFAVKDKEQCGLLVCLFTREYIDDEMELCSLLEDSSCSRLFQLSRTEEVMKDEEGN